MYDDTYHLQSSLGSAHVANGTGTSRPTNIFAFINRVPWHASPGDWQAAVATAESLGATVVLGDWPTEQAQRQAVLDHLLAHANGYTHALIPDGDEIVEPALLQTLLTIAQHSLADRVYVHWDTYWKTPEYVIRPRERFTPCYLIDLRVAKPTGGRNFEGGRSLLLGPEYGIVHHLSWVGPDRRIRRKLETWGHATEVLPGWYERVWQRWESNRLMRNIHPTHPEAYGFVEHIDSGEILQTAVERYLKLAGSEDPYIIDVVVKPEKWPAISVVIPVHGGREDMAACLGALAPMQSAGLLNRILVVDNASPDCAGAKEAELHPFVTLIENDANTGFAHACNQGAEAADPGDHLLFLNSDAVLTRAGLIRMVESLQRSGSIGAVGPLTGNAGHGQQIAPTYTSLETMPLFADDFAHRSADDEDRDMLVGFCLMVRRSVWDEVRDPKTGQGFDERFGLGTFEDNDLCYRIRRAGYRLVLSTRAFVHHGGSKTLVRVAPNVAALLERNRRKFVAKWQADLECGFASGLSGLPSALIYGGPPNVHAGRQPDAGWKPTHPRLRGSSMDLAAGYPSGRRSPEMERFAGKSLTQRVPGGTPIDAGFQPALPGGTPIDDPRKRGCVGFQPALPGRIVFDPARHPDIRLRRTRERARLADISLVMIVRNEERVLGDCLASASPFFREIVVVDTGSTDRTAEIAREQGARVFDFPWTDSFSEARNESMRHASGKWLFWLDADDTLPFASGEAILDAALNAPPSVCGFVVPVQFTEPEANEDGTVAPSAAGTRVDHVKLFRRLPGLAFEGRIHEQILPSLRAAMPNGAIARCPAVVMHTGYDTSPAGQAKKRERDAKLLALDLAERPDHPFVLFNLGMTDHFAAEHEGAVDWLRQSIAAAGQGESHVRKAYALMAVSLRELGRQGEALAAIDEGLAAVGDADPELHFHAGFLLTQMGRYPEARVHYEKSADADATGYFSSFDIGILGYKTYHNLGQVCSLMGDYEEAKRWWSKAVDTAPDFLASAFDLFHAAAEHGDTPTARAMLDAVERWQGRSPNWQGMAARLAAAGTPGGAGGKDLGREKSAVPVDPRLELARRLLQSGDEAAALPHLAALAEDGVANAAQAAEAAYFLGVAAIRRGDNAAALAHMEHALQLNPGHPPTAEQVARLRRLNER